MKIHACQMLANVASPFERLAEIDLRVTAASADGAALVIFPELAVSGYGAGEAIAETAETVDGPLVRRLQALGEDHRIAIVIGIAVREDDGRIINAALAVRPGQAPIVYAKQHLFADYERALFSPGRIPSPVFDVGGLKAGLLICYDVEFPERVRELVLAGAELILVPTALPITAGAGFIAEHIVPVRAFENQVFVVYCNHAGRDALFSYQGQSTIAAPDGLPLVNGARHDADVLVATIDPGRYVESRRENTHLADLAPREDVSVRRHRS